MNCRTQTILKQGAILVLAAVAIGFLINRVAKARNNGEAGAKVWFYDESEKRLYAVAQDTIPPHRGIGGSSGDGVRAVVVAVQGAREKIAYLENYSPGMKKMLEDVQAARKAHRRYEGAVPSRESDFWGTNTFVRRANEETWHPALSEEGQGIMSEWRDWSGPDGKPPKISVP